MRVHYLSRIVCTSHHRIIKIQLSHVTETILCYSPAWASGTPAYAGHPDQFAKQPVIPGAPRLNFSCALVYPGILTRCESLSPRFLPPPLYAEINWRTPPLVRLSMQSALCMHWVFLLQPGRLYRLFDRVLTHPDVVV